MSRVCTGHCEQGPAGRFIADVRISLFFDCHPADLVLVVRVPADAHDHLVYGSVGADGRPAEVDAADGLRQGAVQRLPVQVRSRDAQLLPAAEALSESATKQV